MKPHYEQENIAIYAGDCIDVMKTLPDFSVDAIVTDPPYGLGFMGKEWDGADGFRRSLNAADAGRESAFGRTSKTSPEYRAGHLFQDWCVLWATEALRVLKPGGHLLAFGGSRTYHRLACAVEDAGFEIRDQIQWIYGSGFPKSHNGEWGGTALKPAHEPIVMARKPLIGTVEQNHREHGTGALNIEACRVDAPDGVPTFTHRAEPSANCYGDGKNGSNRTGDIDTTKGRWPANVIHDGSEEVVGMFPQTASGAMTAEVDSYAGESVTGFIRGQSGPSNQRADSGSAARFFKSCSIGDSEWLELHLGLASTAANHFDLQNPAVASALVHAVNMVLPEGLWSELSGFRAPTTIATPSQLRNLAESVIEAILSSARKSLLAPRPEKATPSECRAKCVVLQSPTGTTTITASHWKSDGSADPVTFNIIATNLEVGAKVCGSTSRLIYCAKADRTDRDDGMSGEIDKPLLWSSGTQSPGTFQAEGTKRSAKNNHPTVKPTDLMRYLCRLVTPAGGTVLDPFLGSGSTGRGAAMEGFTFVGIEREQQYVDTAVKRIKAVTRQGLLFGAVTL